MQSKQTPLYDEHKKLNATIVDFCGWQMPVSYAGALQEHEACRSDVGVFDTSHMGNFIFKGDISEINKATTIDIYALQSNKCKYGFLLNDKGGVIDDLIIYKFSDEHLMIIVNAGTCKNDFDILSQRINNQGELRDISDELTKIDIQGPNSIKVLQPYFKDINLDDMKFFSFVECKYNNEYAILSRTGYTGEIGFEIYVPNSQAVHLWKRLLDDNVTPCGLGSRDLLRLEMGYSLYGNELNENITPLEASLDMFVNLDRDFIGKDALLEQKQHGIKQKLYPFISNQRRVARKGFRAYQNNKEVGCVTSGGFSPALKTSIGLVMCKSEIFNPKDGFILQDEQGRAKIPAKVSSLPFLKNKYINT